MLDLQSIRRDDEVLKSFDDTATIEENVLDFLMQLECLSTLIKTRNAFQIIEKKGGHDIEFSAYVINGCTEEFDAELLECQLLDWFKIVERQVELAPFHQDIVDRIRKQETQVEVADASEESLENFKGNLEDATDDRQQRLEILQDLVEDVCLREMNLHILINDPDPQETLALKEMSALGFFGVPLQLAGEVLPVG